jgi:hypothetical protein
MVSLSDLCLTVDRHCNKVNKEEPLDANGSDESGYESLEKEVGNTDAEMKIAEAGFRPVHS